MTGIDFVKRAADRDGPDGFAAAVLRVRARVYGEWLFEVAKRTPLYKALHK